MKTCVVCAKNFIHPTNHHKANTCSTVCKNICTKERNKKFVTDNKQQIKINRMQWKIKNRSKLLGYERKRRMKVEFGLTIEQYEAMADSQNRVCAICALPETRKLGTKTALLSVDHCHSSGKVRGLLCFGCNTSLGKFKDSIELLETAINYLKKSK